MDVCFSLAKSVYFPMQEVALEVLCARGVFVHTFLDIRWAYAYCSFVWGKKKQQKNVPLVNVDNCHGECTTKRSDCFVV